MRLFHLVRHGAHDELGRILSGRSDIGLSAEGRAQARRLAAQLARRPVSRVLSSPRRRCAQTAALIGAATGCGAGSDPALDEIDFGRWTGQDFGRLQADPAWQDWNRVRARARTPAGDSMGRAAGRALRLLRALAAAPGEEAVLVTHLDVIRAVLCRLSGRGFGAVFDLDVPPGSGVRICAGPRGGLTVAPVRTGRKAVGREVTAR